MMRKITLRCACGLLLCVLCGLLLASCNRCSSPQDARSPDGALLLVAPSSILRHIGPLMAGFTKTNPGERVTLIAAEDDDALNYATKGDVFLVIGKSRAEALARKLTHAQAPQLYLNDKVELVARSGFSLAVDRPSHLLQPAIRSIALVEAATPAGQAARATLEDWRLDERLKFKFIPARDSEAALRLVDAGTVDMAFVLRSQHRAYPTLRVLLGRSQRQRGVIPMYMLWPSESPRQTRARALREFLTSKGVLGEFSQKGWLLPGEEAVPRPERPLVAPRIHPSRMPDVEQTTEGEGKDGAPDAPEADTPAPQE
jgi:hypothetical protein